MRRFKVTVNSKEYIVEVEEIKEEGQEFNNRIKETNNETKKVDEEIKTSNNNIEYKKDVIYAPMAGNIIKVNCAIGDEVKKGQVLFVLEAMKMENEVAAPKDGKIQGVLVNQGVTVRNKQPLAEYEG